jgi:hypothetical protein
MEVGIGETESFANSAGNREGRRSQHSCSTPPRIRLRFWTHETHRARGRTEQALPSLPMKGRSPGRAAYRDSESRRPPRRRALPCARPNDRIVDFDMLWSPGNGGSTKLTGLPVIVSTSAFRSTGGNCSARPAIARHYAIAWRLLVMAYSLTLASQSVCRVSPALGAIGLSGLPCSLISQFDGRRFKVGCGRYALPWARCRETY